MINTTIFLHGIKSHLISCILNNWNTLNFNFPYKNDDSPILIRLSVTIRLSSHLWLIVFHLVSTNFEIVKKTFWYCFYLPVWSFFLFFSQKTVDKPITSTIWATAAVTDAVGLAPENLENRLHQSIEITSLVDAKISHILQLVNINVISCTK